MLPAEILRVAQELEPLLEKLPPLDPTKGQFFFSPAGVASIMAFMTARGDVEGRRIACLTTPIVALGLSLLGTAARVTAFDLDGQLLDRIRALSSAETVVYDIRDEVPREHCGSYHCFIIDPLYAVDHYQLCIRRALEMVGVNKGGASGYIVVPPKQVARSKEGGHPVPLSSIVMRLLLESNVYVAEVGPGLAEYAPSTAEALLYQRRFGTDFPHLKWDRPWRCSDVLRVETTPRSQAPATWPKTLTVPVTSGPRLGREWAYVELPPGKAGTRPCRLCQQCYKTQIPGLSGSQVAEAYVPPSLKDVPLGEWRLTVEQLPTVEDACLAFFDVATEAVLVLQGPTARRVYEHLEREARANPQPPNHPRLRNVVRNMLEQYGYDEGRGLEARCRECVEFAIKLIDKGLFIWPSALA